LVSEFQNKFEDYLAGIGMSRIGMDKIEKIYNFYKDSLHEEIKDIFVEDYINKEGSREYESLYLFSNEKIMEARSFLTQDDWDLLYVDVIYWNIKKENYDFMKATKDSRLNIFVLNSGDIGFDLKASQGNCDKLKDIFFKYIKK
jgi:hypothetical protein